MHCLRIVYYRQGTVLSSSNAILDFNPYNDLMAVHIIIVPHFITQNTRHREVFDACLRSGS